MEGYGESSPHYQLGKLPGGGARVGRLTSVYADQRWFLAGGELPAEPRW